MDETYRMLGREREADLERDAEKWRRAAEMRKQERERRRVQSVEVRRRPRDVVPRLAAFLVRGPRTES